MTNKKTARRYAEGTDVPADKSRAELESLLEKHGASEFALHRDAQRTTIIYRMEGRMVRHVLDVPPRADFARQGDAYLYGSRKTDRERQIGQQADAEWRRRWRALLLIVRAKLEIVVGGGSTFAREFLADTLLPNGQTVGEAMLPRIADAYTTGEMPTLMLAADTRRNGG